MSSNGVLFTTDIIAARQASGSFHQLAGPIERRVPLKLVARGRMVRSEEGEAAIEIHQYEFRTQSSTTLM